MQGKQLLSHKSLKAGDNAIKPASAQAAGGRPVDNRLWQKLGAGRGFAGPP